MAISTPVLFSPARPRETKPPRSSAHLKPGTRTGKDQRAPPATPLLNSLERHAAAAATGSS